MQRLLIGFIVLLACLAHQNGIALALPLLHPERFAVSSHLFPAGSRIIRARVESNQQIRQDHVLHFGHSFAAEGRLTGYYMAARRTASETSRVDTSYLVSMFPMAESAQAAFDEQRSSWHLVTDADTDSDRRVANLGDNHAHALITYVAPTGQIFAELLFQRGPIFVEVFQQINTGSPTTGDIRSFFAIAKRLNDRAECRSDACDLNPF
ncbi:MAG: hypothetical protein NVS2B16_34480 [Chloroflexota bacterium]